MSVSNGDHKAHILLSYKLPKKMDLPQQCGLDREIKMTIAKALESGFPDLVFVLTDDECHNGKLPDGFLS